MQDYPTILLLSKKILPIPAVRGGAIETLVTTLLENNEIQQLAKFIVVSVYDEKAAQTKYKNSTVYYFRDDLCIDSKISSALRGSRFRRLFLRALNKFIFRPFFKKNLHIADAWERQCLRIAKREKPDYAIIEGAFSPYLFLSVLEFVGQDRCFHHIHSALQSNPDWLAVCPNVIGVSQFVLDFYHSNWPCGKRIVIKNRINIDLFGRCISQDETQHFRASLGLHPNDVACLYCGRFSQEKGVKELLESFALISNDKIKLILVGSPFFDTATSTKYSDDIVQAASSMGNVSLLGYVPNCDLAVVYQSADILIIPSVCQEAASLAAIEGMASGVPIIATKSGGMHEYLSPECAEELPIDDTLTTSLAQTIERLAADPEKRRRMSLAAKKRALLFSASLYCSDFVTQVTHSGE